MNKTLRIFIFIIGIPFFIYTFLGQLGILSLYNNPSTANEPALKLHSKMLVSNLVKSKIGDFVGFRFDSKEFGKQILVFRLCAVENDTLEIKKGTVYVNNVNVDEQLNLIYNYKIPTANFGKLKEENVLNDNLGSFKIDKEFYLASLDNITAIKYQLLKYRIIENEANEPIKKIFDADWNKDNFGPLIIPKDKIFVLGDNRDNAMDSRYIGFIDKNKIVGVVIMKF